MKNYNSEIRNRKSAIINPQSAMKILLLSAYFPPDTGSASHLFYELGSELVKRGHEVKVVTSFPSYHPTGDLSKYRGKIFMKEDKEGIEVLRIKVPQFPRHIPFARALWQFSLAFLFIFPSLRIKEIDVILVYSPPLTLGITAWILSRLKNAKFILNVQDLFPQSVIDLGILKNKLLIKFFEAMEKFVYKKADFITVHSEGNKEHVVKKGKEPDRVFVIPNWVDIEFLKPNDKNNEFSKKYNLDGKFIVSFAGVLGYSQDIDIILEAAKKLEEYEDIIFIIVGDGVEKPRLVKKAEDMKLKNVRFLPMQPRHIYPQVIQSSDISLATLHSFVKTPVVPSKILSIMAIGKPVIAAMDLNGDAPKLIEEAKCGFAIPPEDSDLLAEKILELYKNKKLRETLGRNGRRYAEKNLALGVCVNKYEGLFGRKVKRVTVKG